MEQMRKCYMEASTVLVLDKNIQQATSQAHATEMLLHIAITDCRSRVWTVQGGFFVRKLKFHFLETAVNTDEIRDHYTSSLSPDNSVDLFILHQVAPALGIELYERGQRKRQQKKLTIASLAVSVSGSAISKPDDEPLCAASLLDQDQYLGILADSPKEDRMKVFWRSQPQILRRAARYSWIDQESLTPSKKSYLLLKILL